MRRSVVALVACASLVGCGDGGRDVPLDNVDDAVSGYASHAQPFVFQIVRCFRYTLTGRDVSAERCVHVAVTAFEELRAEAFISVDVALATAGDECRVQLNVIKARLGSVARATRAYASVAGEHRRREPSLHRALGRATRTLHEAVAAAQRAC